MGNQISSFNVTAFAIAILSMMNPFNGSKKGMLGNLIGGFIVILIGVSLIGPIAQEINNAADCMESNNSLIPEGSTDSFGGAGSSNHFGGYDNTVKHNGFVDAIASTSLVKSNKSLLNPDCIPLEAGSWGRTMMQIVPAFFALAVLAAGLALAYSSLRSGGMI